MLGVPWIPSIVFFIDKKKNIFLAQILTNYIQLLDYGSDCYGPVCSCMVSYGSL